MPYSALIPTATSQHWLRMATQTVPTGKLDAPSEVILRGNELIVMNFDAVFDSDEMVNKTAQKPFTLSVVIHL